MSRTTGRRPHSLGVLLVCAAGLSVASAQQRPPTMVAVTTVQERTIPPSLRLVGSIQPDRAVVVASEVSGVVAAFEAEEGQYLQAGDVLCRLDGAVAEYRLQEAEATLQALSAELEELENGERPEDLARLEAVVAEVEALLRKAEFDLERLRGLHERQQSSFKEFFDAEMDYLANRGRLAQARAQLDRARNGARPEVLARARQAVAAQKAVVARLQREYDRTVVRAPFAGAVVSKRTDTGEWLGEGGAVCEFIALDTVKVRVDVPESAIMFAQRGAPATVEIEALRKSLAAQISRIIPQASPAARTFPVEVDLPNTDRTLLPGMFVWTYVPSGPSATRLMVNKDAIVADPTGKRVMLVRPGPEGQAIASPLPVTTGLEIGGEIEVQGTGLQAGDVVVARANERLIPGPVIPHPMEEILPQQLPGARSAGEPATSNQGADRS